MGRSVPNEPKTRPTTTEPGRPPTRRLRVTAPLLGVLTTLACAWIPAIIAVDGDRPQRAERFWILKGSTVPDSNARWDLGIRLDDGTRALGKRITRLGMTLRQTLREPRWADALAEADGRPIERPIPARLLPVPTSTEAGTWIDATPATPGRVRLNWAFGLPVRLMTCSCEVSSTPTDPAVWHNVVRLGWLSPDGILPTRVRWGPFAIVAAAWTLCWFGTLRLLVPVWCRAAWPERRTTH